MTTSTQTYREEMVDLATGKIRVLRGGSGPPVVVLHHDIGNVGWLDFHEKLAGRFDVLAPDLPGFDKSERPEWARHPRDLAIIMNQFLDKLDLGRITLVGLGFGGWVAAEMATMNQTRLASLVLVGPMGIQPEQGEILDQIMVSHGDYVLAGFRSREALVAQYGEEPSMEHQLAWDLNREMVARIAWKPYMFSHQLPPLLRGVETPALVVWGGRDAVVPPECGQLYAQWLPKARLEVIAEAGHFVDMEEPARLAELIAAHART